MSALDLTSLFGSALGALSKFDATGDLLREGLEAACCDGRDSHSPNGGNGRPFNESLRASYAAILRAATTYSKALSGRGSYEARPLDLLADVLVIWLAPESGKVEVA